jgi:hypothetical protein
MVYEFRMAFKCSLISKCDLFSLVLHSVGEHKLITMLRILGHVIHSNLNFFIYVFYARYIGFVTNFSYLLLSVLFHLFLYLLCLPHVLVNSFKNLFPTRDLASFFIYLQGTCSDEPSTLYSET